MKHIGLASALLLTLCLSSCLIQKRKDVDTAEITKNVTTSEFSSISIAGAYSLVYRQGDSCSVTMSGPKNLLDRVKVSHEGETLSIRQEDHSFTNMFGRKSMVTVYVTSPLLTEIVLAGTGNFNVADTMAVKKLNFNLSGAGSVNIDHLKCDTLQMNVSGAANMTLGLHDCHYSGINMQGAGNADVNYVNCGLSVCTIAGAGNMTLSGDLTNLVENKSGVASIRKQDLRIKEK